jgi:LytS/YehU family sensor histidine kinase
VLVTGVLVGAYVGLVVGLSAVARSLTGSTDIAVAASTLVVAALFRPLLRRVRSRIDHRFNRARYDAARTIEEFSSRLRDEIDIDTLEAELRDVVNRTMQPSSISLCMRD